MWLAYDRARWGRLVRAMKPLGLVVLLSCGMGCGEHRGGIEPDASTLQRCDLTQWAYYDSYCLNAGLLALRYGGNVVVTQDSVDVYYQLAAHAYNVEPVTRLAVAAGVNNVFEVPLYSAYPAIVDAWSAGQLATGDSIVDEMFLGNGMTSVSPWRMPQTTPPSFNAIFEAPVSEDVLLQQLQRVPDTWLGAPPERPPNDVTLRTFKDATLLHMVAGWGDCFSGCTAFHSWDVTVYADERTTVVDLGGDPIPESMRQAALTSPDP